MADRRADTSSLPVRRPTLRDARAIYELQAAVDLHDFGSIDLSEDEVRDELEEVDLAHDAWLVPDPHDEAAAVAYATLTTRGHVVQRIAVAVHPQWRRRGVGTALAEMATARGMERVGEAPAGARVVARGWIKADFAGALRWADALGYQPSRRFLRMRIDLAEAPELPRWPDGVTVRNFEPRVDDVATHAALEAAFADHWGHVPATIDDFRRRRQRSDFDADLWHLAMDGDRVIGTATNSVLPGEIGWVSGLGVVPSHRRRGIARAILQHSFRVFWDRGIRVVALGVDADSLTGATRLYESAGMRVEEEFQQVRRELRAGYSSLLE